MRTSKVVYALVALLIVGALATIGWARRGDYSLYTVRTGSMEPHLHIGDAVLVRPIAGAPAVGDVITFRLPDSGRLVTHRVVAVDGAKIVTKGDANKTPDTWNLTTAMVVGKVIERLPSFGYVFVFLKQPTGAASIMTVLFALILLWKMFFPPATALASRLRAFSSRSTEQAELPWTDFTLALEGVAVMLGGTCRIEPPSELRRSMCNPLAIDPPPIDMGWTDVTLQATESLCTELVASQRDRQEPGFFAIST
jgi:signal peptidase